MHANTYECGFKHSHSCWQMTAGSSDQVFNAWLGLEEAAQDIKLLSTEDRVWANMPTKWSTYRPSAA